MSESAVDQAARGLRSRILTGRLRPGERLRPERELSLELGINRLTLRAALGQLVAANLLSVRQGSGYVVRSWQTEGGPDLLRSLADIAGTDELARIAEDLLLVRRQLAAAVLNKLTAGVDAGARRRIHAAVSTYLARAEEGVAPDEAAALDRDILEAILAATGSVVLSLCLNPISAVLEDLPALRRAMYDDALGGARAYGVLLPWLEYPDAAVIPAILATLEARDAVTVAKLGELATKAPTRTKKRSS